MPAAAPSLTTLNLKLLQTFVLVAEQRSFRKAAELALRSQSAVSAQIRQLEAQLGLPLFHRTTRSVSLTPEGEQLLSGARRAADEVEHSLRVVRELAELRHGRVSLGCAPTVAAGVIPGVLAEFERDYPAVRVLIREVASDGLIAALRDGRIDFAVAQAVPPEPDMRVEPLFDDPIVALAPVSMIRRRRTSMDLAELAGYPLLQLAPVTSMRQLFDAEMRSRGLSPSCRYDCINALTLIALADAGLGIAIVPRSVLRLVHGNATRSITLRPGTLSRSIALISRSDRALSPAAARLAQLIREKVPGTGRAASTTAI